MTRASQWAGDAYNAAVERVALPFGDLLLRTEFMRSLRWWRRTQHLGAPALEAVQRDNLTKLLRHATSKVPYYRDLSVPKSGDPYAWLRRFPILTKTELRSDGEGMCTPGVPGLHPVSSSGSSGERSTVWMTSRESSRTMAIQTLWWEWAGYRLGDRLLQTGMTPDRGLVKGVKDRLLRTTYIEAFGLDDATMVSILERGHDRPWRVFGGYASSLHAFALAAETARLSGLHFDSVISWGDKMFEHYRRQIESTFHTHVHDLYGTTEGLCIAAQRDSTEYYVMTPHVVLELLDEAWEPVADGELGRVVISRLDALGMPLIRYYLGDLAVRPRRPVDRPGQLAFPQLERIVGRDTDVFRTPGGRTLTVHTFTGVFEHVPEIRQFSVIPAPEAITVEYIPAEGCDARTLAGVTDRLHKVIGEAISITWAEVDQIPDSPSGKPQIIRRPSGEDRR